MADKSSGKSQSCRFLFKGVDNFGSDFVLGKFDFAGVEGVVLCLDEVVDLAVAMAGGFSLKIGAVFDDVSGVDFELF